MLWRMNMGFARDGRGTTWFRDAFTEHFWVTTSGFFSDPALLHCIQEIGIDRVLFSVDYPFVDNPPGTRMGRPPAGLGGGQGQDPQRQCEAAAEALGSRRERGNKAMRVLCVHPGPLMYTRIFLRLEPLGLELVAASVRQAGHEVALIDLQVESHAAFFGWVARWRPDVVLFSCNYLANVPEIVDLAKGAKARLPRSTICVGGHSASFVADALIQHGEGAIDCVVRGEGEAAIPPLLAAIEAGGDLAAVPGVVTASGQGPAPSFVHSLDELLPARDLLRHRRKYFLGVLDPCASIEFSRGCPWDCSFCSAWTFYGRSYRVMSPERVIEDLKSIREPGVFIVDDVAFIQERHGMELGEAIARAGIKKRYYLETRGDVLLRNKEVFEFWKKLGVSYMFLGLEALDEEGLAQIPQARAARPQFRGARIRPLARRPHRDQPDRRSRLGSRALPRRARVVRRAARDRQYQRQHAVSRHRELADRGAPAADAATTGCSTSSTRCCRPSCRWRSSMPSW